MPKLLFELIPVKPGVADICVSLKDPNETFSFDKSDRLKVETFDQKWLDSKGGSWIDHACTLNVTATVSDRQITYRLGPEYVKVLERKRYKATVVRGRDQVVGSGTFNAINIEYGMASGVIASSEPTLEPEPQHTEKPPESTETNTPIKEEKTPEEQQTKTVETPPPEKKKSYLVWICVALAAALIAIVVYFLLSGSKQESVETEKTKEQTVKVEEKKVLSPREIVQQYFANQKTRTGSSAVELAKTIEPKTGEDYDALFRLYYYAVGEQNKDAYVPYAKYLDPSLPDLGTIKKSPVEAWEYYKKAGSEQMASNLKKWVEDRAAQGNAQAKVWLTKMN